jgi:hypothetical protein
MALASGDVLGEHLAGRCMQGDQAGLPKLGTTDRQHRCRQIDIVKFKVEGFAQPQARNTQQPEQAIVDPGQQGTALVAMRHVARGIE